MHNIKETGSPVPGACLNRTGKLLQNKNGKLPGYPSGLWFGPVWFFSEAANRGEK